MALIDDLLNAKGPVEKMRHVARATWAKAHDGAECPDKSIPDPNRDLVPWLNADGCPDDVLTGMTNLANNAWDVLLQDSGDTNSPFSHTSYTYGTVRLQFMLLEASVRLPGQVLLDTGDVELLIDSLHHLWIEARAHDPNLLHPLGPLVNAWQRWREAQGDSPVYVHVIVTREKRPPKKAEPLTLARSPGLLALFNTPLQAVEVDGEPLVTAAPAGVPRRRYRVAAPEQGELWPAPRKLSGQATGGALIEVVSGAPLGGDERSPLRADLIRIGTLAYALSRPMRLTTGELSHLVTGQDTPQGREQGLRLAWTMRGAAVMVAGEPWSAFDAEVGDTHRIGAPRWWLDAGVQGLDTSARGPTAHRLTGVLFRRIPGEGRKATRWGTLERTIAGIEGALLWGPSAGRGRRGRLPDAVRPVRRGGPGATVIIPWYQLLRLSGEHVTPAMLADKAKRATLNRRYNFRIDALITANYHCGTRGEPAPAGDTVEIVQRIKGGRHHEGAIVARTTARFCAAYAHGGERTELPASHLFESVGDGSSA